MVSGSPALLLGAAAVFLSTVINAHVALWHPSMYGFCDGGNGIKDKCIDTSNPIIPLQQQDFGPGTRGQGWWFHGAMDQPPAADKFFDFPAGGKVTAELQCNKGQTSWQIGDEEAKKVINVCSSNTNVHTKDTWAGGPTDDTKGCAIAIAWKSDPKAIVPSDLIVVSTNRSCPFYHYTDFHLPADLPACPSGGCHAFWLWIHEAGDYGGYSKQMYMTPFKAKVSGAKNKVAYPAPRLARKCVGAPNICVKGPKQPHFWMQNEKNNANNPDFDPPYYNVDYNFANGAQMDLAYKPNPTAETAWKKNWNYLGCYYDHDRMLGQAYIESWQNEPEFCMAQCDAAGKKYAAVEYGYQCMCGDSIVGEKIAESNCNIPCTANSAVMCGAGGIMNIYVKGSVAATTTAKAAVTTTTKAAATTVAKAATTTAKTAAATAAKTIVAAAAKAAAVTTSPKAGTTTAKLTKEAATTTAKKIATTTAKVTSTAKVVARGFDEDGNETEEELDEPVYNVITVRETETVYQFVTVTVEATPTAHLERKDIPFLHKPLHGHNRNHHVGFHI